MNICECGCGNECNNRFVSGHNPPRYYGGTKKCKAGCTCKRHLRITDKCLPGCICKKHYVSAEKRINLSISNRGKHLGHIAWNKGIPCSLETIQKIKKTLKGHVPWIKGKTKETDAGVAKLARSMIGNQNGRGPCPEGRGKKISLAKKGKPLTVAHIVALKKSWSDPERAVKRIRASLKGSANRPNKSEIFLLNLLQTIDLNWTYVGDGSFIIERKNPDFVNFSRQTIIEFQGCYFHSCKICNRNDDLNKNTFPERQILFEKHGYKSIEIWGHEFKDLDALSKKLLIFQMCNILNRAASPGLFLGA